MDVRIPASVVVSAAGRADAVLVGCTGTPLVGGTGAATAAVVRLTAWVRCGRDELVLTMIRKQCQPVASARHANAAADPRHWAYWRREPLVYATGLVPAGPDLAAPRCYGVVDDVIYLAEVSGPGETAEVAASRLGAWQATAAIPDVPWLAGHQLAQRIAVTELDWTAVNADPRLAGLWRRRRRLLGDLDAVPRVLSHGDFHAGNLVATGATTTVLDWGTLGAGPAGADLAHLALSTLAGDLIGPYLAGLAGRFDPEPVRLGYRATLVLTGISRLHWMLARRVPVPDGYLDLVLDAAERLAELPPAVTP